MLIYDLGQRTKLLIVVNWISPYQPIFFCFAEICIRVLKSTLFIYPNFKFVNIHYHCWTWSSGLRVEVDGEVPVKLIFFFLSQTKIRGHTTQPKFIWLLSMPFCNLVARWSLEISLILKRRIICDGLLYRFTYSYVPNSTRPVHLRSCSTDSFSLNPCSCIHDPLDLAFASHSPVAP